MGLFNKKSKAEKALEKEKDALNAAFASQGARVVSKTQSEKNTKKEVHNRMVKRVQTKALIEKLNDVRFRMNANPTFARLVDRLERVISTLSNSYEGSDEVVIESLNNLMDAQVGQCIDFINRNSYTGMLACLDAFENLVNDRTTCQPYYKNLDYVTFKIQMNKAYAEAKAIYARITQINENGQALLAVAKDPANKAHAQEYKAELDSYTEERSQLESRAKSLTTTFNNLKIGVLNVEQYVFEHKDDENFDVDVAYDKIMEYRAMNQDADKKHSKVHNKLTEVKDVTDESSLAFSSHFEDSVDATSKQSDVDFSSYNF